MPLTLEVFRDEFDQSVKDLSLTWEAVGFYTPNHRVYPFGTDTKVISTVFEALSAPIISTIAAKHGYIVEGSEQTIYPDFTLSPSPGVPPRIALDIKTTYRRFNKKGEAVPFRYTLGSYTSFLRDPTASKNIKYTYGEYSDHWTLGFLYTRREGVGSKVYYRPEEVTDLLCPYLDVEYFIQHKYKIVGVSPASGNTTNIGSFPTCKLEDLREGKGPFASVGKEMCDQYWRSYGRTAGGRPYSNWDEFLTWIKNR
jgi:hypothetical protein